MERNEGIYTLSVGCFHCELGSAGLLSHEVEQAQMTSMTKKKQYTQELAKSVPTEVVPSREVPDDM